MSHPVFLSIGEVMIRDTPQDGERLERTRSVHLSTAGSEFSIAVGVSRLGNQSRFITRLPDNPYGRMIQNVAHEQSVDSSYFVWGQPTDLVGRYLYEVGVSPRAGVGIYQRKFSAASLLDSKSVDWKLALKDVKLFHTSGITLGLSFHSEYTKNYLLECVLNASSARGADALFGLDINYRGTLWSKEQMLPTVETVLRSGSGVQMLITSIEDCANFFDLGYGKLSPKDILAGVQYTFEPEPLRKLSEEFLSRYGLRCLCLTKRKIISSSLNTWMSAVVLDGQGVISEKELQFKVVDRLGGGDAWASGLYTGILEEGLTMEGISKGLKLGDAAVCFQQTLMFDLPILNRKEVELLASGNASERVQR